jgi:hypothetical protein
MLVSKDLTNGNWKTRRAQVVSKHMNAPNLSPQAGLGSDYYAKTIGKWKSLFAYRHPRVAT